MQDPSKYYPLRALAGWTIIFAAVWTLFASDLRAAFVVNLTENQRIQSILDRFFDNLYQQAIFVLFGGAVIYLLFQLVVLTIDRHQILDGRKLPPNRLIKFVGVLAGRNWGFWSQSFIDTGGGAHLRHGAQYSAIPLQILLWAFPMFGFLGTVYGLSGAVLALSRLDPSGGMTIDEIQPVFSELDVAFDTTIQGIVSALLLALLILPLDIGWARLRQSS